MQGKQIANGQIGSGYIDISNLPKGIYLAKIVGTGASKVVKFVKE